MSASRPNERSNPVLAAGPARAPKKFEELREFIVSIIEPLGYELIDLQVKGKKSKQLQLFIDHLNSSSQSIAVEDCVRVSKSLNEPFEQSDLINRIFPESYSLEVSSPGIERPLTKIKHYERFTGKTAWVHVFRPLTSDEMENTTYQAKNPKQKNFVGTLGGIQNEKVVLSIEETQKKKKVTSVLEPLSEIKIPFSLITKAHLKVNFDQLNDHRTEEKK